MAVHRGKDPGRLLFLLPVKVASPRLLWTEFAQRGLRPLVLRDFDHLPDAVASDLDLAIENPTLLPRMEEAIEAFARAAGLELVTVVRRSYVWQFKLLGSGSAEQLVIDVHPEGEGWHGPLYLTSGELFAEASDHGGWQQPAPHHQAMMAVFQHLLWGGFYKAKYHSLVPQWIVGHEQPFTTCVARAFGSDLAPRLVQMIMNADGEGLAALVPALRRRLWRERGLTDLAGSLRRLLAFVGTEIALTAARRGRWIVLVGPDGVGKTTVAGRLEVETKPFFRGTRYHHWIPSWSRPLYRAAPPGGSKPTTRPRQSGARAVLVSLARLGRNVIRAHMGFWLRVWPHLLRQRLVIGDRYLFNYWVDPASVCYSGPAWFVRAMLSFAPKPDLVVALVAPPDVIHGRKPELTPSEITAVLARLDTLAMPGLRVRTICANRLVDDVATDLARFIIRTLA